MMTFNEKRIEAIARKRCELMGVDPDGSVTHGATPSLSGFVADVALFSPRWTLEVAAVKEWLLMHAAIWDSDHAAGPVNAA